MKLEFSRQSFEKHTNIKSHENLSSGSRVDPCGRTDGQANMAKLKVAFRKFANAPKNDSHLHTHTHRYIYIYIYIHI